MEIEERPIKSIRPYPDNPRINDQAVDAVAASIRAFGFRQPIFENETGDSDLTQPVRDVVSFFIDRQV